MTPSPPRALLLAAAAAILLLLIAASYRRIWETDFWWQYKTGEIVATHGVPRVDTLSFASEGRPWIEMRWLYCDLLYRIVGLFGFPGAVTVKGLVVLASFLLAVAAGPWRKAPVAACAVLPVAILASTQRFYVRPELASFLFFALYSWILSRYRRDGGRMILVLPLLQVLWANLHTLFLLGPAVVGLFVVVEAARLLRVSEADRREARRRVALAAIVLVATCGACFVTPYGARGVAFGASLLRELEDPVFRQISAELVSPFALGRHYTAVFYFEALVAICAVAALASMRRLEPFGSLLLVSQLYLAATSVRNLPLFCLAAVPFVIGCAARSRLAAKRLVTGIVLLLTIAFCGVQSWRLVTDRFHVDQGDSNQFGATLARHRFPEGATRFVKEHPELGRLFNSIFEGSYLVAHDVPVFIDPRLEVHGDEELARYVRMTGDGEAWREALARYDLRAALVDLQSPFLRHLADRAGWRVAYFDDVAAVFVRAEAAGSQRSPEPVDWPAAVARARELLPPLRPRAEHGFLERVDSPVPYIRVADFLLRMQHVELAEPFARDALGADPRTPGAHMILGEALQAGARWDEALREYEAELAIVPENTLARRQAGILHFRAGHAARSVELLERSVRDVANDAQVWAVLTKLHADARRAGDALRSAQKAAELEPSNAEYVKNLGRMYGENGRLDEGIATLERGLAIAPRDAGTYGDLAEFLLRKGRTDDARSAVERGLALDPADPVLRRMREHIASTSTR